MSQQLHCEHDAANPVAVGDIIQGSDRQGRYLVERIDECDCVFYGPGHLNIITGKVDPVTHAPLRDGQYFFMGYRYFPDGLYVSAPRGEGKSARNSQIHVLVRHQAEMPSVQAEDTIEAEPALGGLFG